MTDKEAFSILLSLKNKYPLTDEEKEAISNATGILGWAALNESRIKKLKRRREEDLRD